MSDIAVGEAARRRVAAAFMAAGLAILALLWITASHAQVPPHELVMDDGRGTIYTVFNDGTGKVVLPEQGHTPSWTPDGRRILYATTNVDRAVGRADAFGGSAVWIMNADGSSPHQIGPAFALNVDKPSMARNGTIVFTLTIRPVDEVWLIQEDGSNLRRLVANGSQASISLNGSRVAYMVQTETDVEHREVWISNVDGSNAYALTTPGDPDYPDANAPAISPDGSVVVFFSGLAAIGDGPWGYRNIAWAPIEGGPRHTLTGCAPINTPGPDLPGSCRAADNPFLFPDGRSVGFDRGSANTSDSGTYAVDFPSGANLRQLSPELRGGGAVPIKEMTP
jgi:hypothetical protein